jgi:uncharacterized delta-60 repeat protein
MKRLVGLNILFAFLSNSPISGANGSAQLDPTFNPNLFIGGREGNFNHGVKSIALQTDGKILIGGTFTNVNGALRHNLARLNPDGTLDHTFVPIGTTNDFVQSIVVQQDNKILLTGGSQNPLSSHGSTVIRLKTDGSPDPVFHVPALSSGASQILLGHDSMIYLCGTFNSVNNSPRRYLARLHPNGEVDDTYVPPILGHPSTEGGMVRMAQQSDLKIVLAGMFYTTNGGGIFARFNQDGSEDLSFRPRGVYSCSDLQVLPNNQILHVASTQFNSEYAVLRAFDLSGNQIPSFRDRNEIPGRLQTTAFQPDGRILVGGQFHLYDGQPRTNLVRLMGQRAFLRTTQVDPNGFLALSWEILPNAQLWQIQSSEDLLSWTIVKEKITPGSVQLKDVSKASAKFFRIVPE